MKLAKIKMYVMPKFDAQSMQTGFSVIWEDSKFIADTYKFGLTMAGWNVIGNKGQNGECEYRGYSEDEIYEYRDVFAFSDDSIDTCFAIIIGNEHFMVKEDGDLVKFSTGEFYEILHTFDFEPV